MVGEVITVAQLRQLLDVQTELRQQAEDRWRAAQRALLGILETFAPDEVDRRLKSGQALDSLNVEDLAQLIRQRLSANLKSSQASSGMAERGLEIKTQLASAQKELEEAKHDGRVLVERNQALGADRDSLMAQLAALQQVSSTQAPPKESDPASETKGEAARSEAAPEPDWMAAWRKAETFERDSAILRQLGETGLARRPMVEQQAAERLGLRKAGGSIQSVVSRLEDLHLVEIFRPWDASGAKTGGRLPDLIRLSDRGRLAYWLLAGSDPVPNEFDFLLPRHVSAEHTLLNLQAADVLRATGCKVEATPPDIHLPNGGLFRPDLLAVEPGGRTLYVEVEAEANKNREQRLAKWRNASQAGGGRLNVFCDNRSCMRNIRSEINYALGRQVAQCFLTNLADLQAGKRALDGGIWLEVRQNHDEGNEPKQVNPPGSYPGSPVQSPRSKPGSD